MGSWIVIMYSNSKQTILIFQKLLKLLKKNSLIVVTLTFIQWWWRRIHELQLWSSLLKLLLSKQNLETVLKIILQDTLTEIKKCLKCTTGRGIFIFLSIESRYLIHKTYHLKSEKSKIFLTNATSGPYW